ncbi:MAG: ABC transporter permease [Blastocatellia bacterium]|nr:MAG: ABC transporter permease [Blastocatellia bacterium]
MPPTSQHFWPLPQLILARLRTFYREPGAVFWVYGFPLLMVVVLGIAFRTSPVQTVTVDVQAGPGAGKIRDALLHRSDQTALAFVVQINDEESSRRRLRTGKTDLIVLLADDATYQYRLDKSRAESRLARTAVHEVLQKAAGRKDPVRTLPDQEMLEPGSRYIDFLVPGLLGMSLMGGGLWGVGFAIVDMRIRKLLKRFVATPMRRSDFLLGIMLSRLVFMIPEVLVLLLFARLFFGVRISGNVAAVLVLILLGAFTFAGMGLLVASRARTLETASGLMNLTMLPMWLLSGIFFSPDRFPQVIQPVIKGLPLTPLIEGLRSVMLEGASLASQSLQVVILLIWGSITFVLGLRWFRWN